MRRAAPGGSCGRLDAATVEPESGSWCPTSPSSARSRRGTATSGSRSTTSSRKAPLGLLDAIDHFAPHRSGDFESYARFRIRRAIRNALTEQARLIRLPKHVVERRRTIEQAEARLTAAANGRRPTPPELAAATGLSLAAVLETRATGFAPISLDEPVLPDGSPLEAAVVDPAARDPELEALEHERTEQLRTAIGRLPERQRRIVSRHWGLDGAPQTTVALAAELDLSPRRTQAIERDALYELRAALE